MNGVVHTRAGYAGGTSHDPTYRRMGNHTECIQVDYDPAVITYGHLLDEFWAAHSPVTPSRSRQYASLILAADSEQLSAALAAREQMAEAIGRDVYTEIRPLEGFYPAEDYHQKYALRRDRMLSAEVRARYPDEVDFRESTAAARLNGYVYGMGTAESLEPLLPRLGLSKKADAHLRGLVRS